MKMKYIVTWKSKSVRKEASFDEKKLAESFYQEKLEEGKEPALFFELVESTTQRLM